MNYPELRAAIQTYSLDFEPSFASNIDLFIHLAEARLRQSVRLPNFRKDIVDALTAGQQLWNVPADFLGPDSFEIVGLDGELIYLINKDAEFIDECYPNQNMQGPPRFYCYLNNLVVKVGPTPDFSYQLNVGYFYRPASITQTQTSWLGDNFQHALVSGALVEAAKYMKSEDNIYQRCLTAWMDDLQMDLQYAKGRAKKDTYQEPDARAPI